MSKNSTSSGNEIRRILVPIDGSPNSNRALKLGINLAKTYNAELIVLNVIATPTMLVSSSAFGAPANGLETYYEKQEGDAAHFIEEALSLAQTQGLSKVKSEVNRGSKSVVEGIIDSATRSKVDLIVIGTRGLGGFKKLLLGSVSSGVVSHAHCNVMVVR